MKKIAIDDLQSNESYEAQRPAFRKAMMEHKNNRRVQLGPNATLHFEDYMTMRYQVQELMRAEQITGMEEIREELEAYNPLIPDGQNLKVTFMLEYPDETERRQQLGKSNHRKYSIRIHRRAQDPVYPIANEDLVRSTDDKTSSVHFLRFEFPRQTIDAAKDSASWTVTCEHENHSYDIRSLSRSMSVTGVTLTDRPRHSFKPAHFPECVFLAGRPMPAFMELASNPGGRPADSAVDQRVLAQQIVFAQISSQLMIAEAQLLSDSFLVELSSFSSPR